MFLFAAVASAAAFVGRITGGAAFAGLYLNAAEGAEILFVHVEFAAFHAAADIRIGFFLRHGVTSLSVMSAKFALFQFAAGASKLCAFFLN